MSWLTSFLKVISFGLYKGPTHGDYHAAQQGKHWYWRKDRLGVYVAGATFGEYVEIGDAVQEWRGAARECGITIIFEADPARADIHIERGDAVSKGGVAVRQPVKGTDREIAWAKIVIAKGEKGKRLKAVALHEMGHALGLTHDGAYETDAMNARAIVTSLSAADKATLKKCYEERG